jgi:plasmid stability protein
MAQILVRNLEDAVLKRIKARAKANRRSAEAEARAILAAAVPSHGGKRARLHLLAAWLRSMPMSGRSAARGIADI